LNELQEYGGSEYEIYLKTNILFAAQKKFSEFCNADELQFQLVHQSIDLYLKLIAYTLLDVLDYMVQRNTNRILTLFNRVHKCERLMTNVIELFDTMSPKEYQTIRLFLGSGSGEGSPGFRTIGMLPPKLWEAYEKYYLKDQNLTVDKVYNSEYSHDDAYVVAQAMLDFDALMARFFQVHFEAIRRAIGDSIKSLSGREVNHLKGLGDRRYFPELWNIRSKMTDEWCMTYGYHRDPLTEESAEANPASATVTDKNKK
jgi:tryptophan 2,3-dioxygenase